MPPTTTVLVPPADHQRASDYVARALSGHGSLEGFFDFLGQASVRLAKRYPPTGGSQSPDGPLATLATITAQDVFAPRDRYVSCWEEAREKLRWFREGLPEAHLLALFFLLDVPEAWSMVPLWRDRASPAAPTDLFASMDNRRAWANVDRALTLFGYQASVKTPRLRDVARARYVSEGVLLEWAEDVPQPVETSLDSTASEVLVRAFGSGVYARVENALVRMFEDPAYVLDVWREAEALEFGSMPNTKPSTVLEKIREVMDDLDPMHEGGVVGPPGSRRDASILADVEYARDEPRSEWFDRLVPALGYDPQFAEVTHPFWQRVESDYNAKTEVAWLFIARDLGIVKSWLDLERLDDGFDLQEAFKTHYRLDRIAPSRDALHSIVSSKARAMPKEVAGDVATAVDFHVVELFRLYVAEVTGGRDDSWRHRAKWTTLAQPDLLLMTTVLEAWSGSQVVRDSEGAWKVREGDQDVMRLDHRQALRVVSALRFYVPIQATLSHETSMLGLLLAVPKEYRSTELLIHSSPGLLGKVIALLEANGSAWNTAVSFLEQVVGLDHDAAVDAHEAFEAVVGGYSTEA